MTMTPALARGGFDLAVGGRGCDVVACAIQPEVRLIAVGPRRTLCASGRRLVSIDGPLRRRLFARRDPACRYRDGDLWYLGRDGAIEVIGVRMDEDEAAEFFPLADAAGSREETTCPAWVSIRRASHLLAAEASLASHAVALAVWWRRSRRCTRCGAPVAAQAGGWEQRCLGCGAVEYPRQDPSIIVAVTDKSERLLLAHNVAWQPRARSLIAGYIEAGEAAERAVEREVAEETGLIVTDPTYVASQAWPFPRSLMLGFRAHVVSGELALDDEELDSACFVTRDEFDEACRDERLIPPGPAAIAAALIEDWLGHGIIRPAGVARWEKSLVPGD